MAAIRAATAADAQTVADIYNEGIATRLATFETEPRGASDVEAWLAAGERLPLLVAEEDGRCSAGRASRPTATDPSTPAWGRCRSTSPSGRAAAASAAALLEALQQRAVELGYWKLLGKLFTANAASAGMVRSCGWREVGMHHRHSRLDGEWRDVLVVERVLYAGRVGVPPLLRRDLRLDVDVLGLLEGLEALLPELAPEARLLEAAERARRRCR